MKLLATALPGVVLIEPVVFEDARGWFMESFSAPRFEAGLAALGLPAAGDFVQDNHSLSRRGVLRGLHYQLPPFAQGKLVRVARGTAYDIVLDMRPGAATRGEWAAFELSAANRRQLWIPAGFAHGFLALEDDTELLYKTTAPYDGPSSRAIDALDPALGIAWPQLAEPPTRSEQDRSAPSWASLSDSV